MSKLYNDISKMKNLLNIIEQYNNYTLLGATEEIIYLREKIDNLYNIKDTSELIKEFTWCANMINMFYNEIDPEFKRYASNEKDD